jgi:hypothetical protein
VFDGHVHYRPWTPREGNHLVSLDQRTGEVDFDVDLRTMGEAFGAPFEAPTSLGADVLVTTDDGHMLVLQPGSLPRGQIVLG